MWAFSQSAFVFGAAKVGPAKATARPRATIAETRYFIGISSYWWNWRMMTGQLDPLRAMRRRWEGLLSTKERRPEGQRSRFTQQERRSLQHLEHGARANPAPHAKGRLPLDRRPTAHLPAIQFAALSENNSSSASICSGCNPSDKSPGGFAKYSALSRASSSVLHQ
jgi:hypothetical protein